MHLRQNERVGRRWPNQQIKKMIPPHDRPRMDRVVTELRQNDLSCRDIAAVVSLYEAYDITPNQVAEWVKRLGLTGQHPKARQRTSRMHTFTTKENT